MTLVSTAKAANAGTLDGMTAHTAAPARTRVRTGGPTDDSSWLEHVLGWTLVVVVAMFVTQLGWI